ncbi:cellulose binding domain-containing protein [Micromonospora chalcea]
MRTRRRFFVAAALAVATAAIGAATVAAPAGAESNGGVRVMPLGDSITEGTQVPGGYRIGLWQRLTGGGYRVDLVGSQYNGPASLGDHDHEGHPGWRIDQIDANIVGWLRATTPKTVLLHIGTNDILQNYNVSSAPSRLSNLIDKITTTAPDAEVFVAQLIPLSNPGQESAVRTFNAAIPGIVQGKANTGKRVHLVDLHSALTAGDLIDGIHPTANGYDKMAAVWYNALRAVPGSIGIVGGPTTPPPSTPSPSPSTTPTTPPPGGGACSATYALAGQWQGGFQATVTVTAGSAAISGWTVTWTWANGQTISQSWNATVSTSGATVTARNVSYNGALGAGASTEFGFLGSVGGTNTIPTLRCAAA